MQNVELSKVKSRIKALTNKTVERGCTEHEAMEAMAAVGRLLAQYNLTMSEIDVREQVCKTVYVPMTGKRRGAVDGCIMALAGLFDARTWFFAKHELDMGSGRYIKKTYYAFFGTENDLEMIQYLLGTISSAIKYETAQFAKSDLYKASQARKTATVSFGHGMAARIAQRLRALKDEMNIAASTGRSLILLKGQLVNEEFKKTGLKLRTSYSQRRIRNGSAYSQGAAAGDRVNLNRPISGGNKVGGYLT